MYIPIKTEVITSAGVSFWAFSSLIDLYPNSKRNTLAIEFIIINGILVTVPTDPTRFIGWDRIPGSSPHPPIPSSVSQRVFSRDAPHAPWPWPPHRMTYSSQYRAKAMVARSHPEASLPFFLIPRSLHCSHSPCFSSFCLQLYLLPVSLFPFSLSKNFLMQLEGNWKVSHEIPGWKKTSGSSSHHRQTLNLICSWSEM